MASVIRAKWGTHPSFLNALSNKRTLFDALAPLAPNNAVVGAKVVPTAWINKGIEGSFWTITSASFTHGFRDGVVMGVRTWKGKADPKAVQIKDTTRFSWRLYTDPSEIAQLKKKL
ncbi:hypothetical protein BDR26DRAFT_1002804 [Obelidium mucronatum]|nr:hypothetical protein BDR26DRAFT_1002804 [Obelidium mucronatum]